MIHVPPQYNTCPARLFSPQAMHVLSTLSTGTHISADVADCGFIILDAQGGFCGHCAGHVVLTLGGGREGGTGERGMGERERLNIQYTCTYMCLYK